MHKLTLTTDLLWLIGHIEALNKVSAVKTKAA